MTALHQDMPEEVYFNEQDIRVTKNLLLTKTGSYAISHIRSVKVGVQKLSRVRSASIGGLLGLLMPFFIRSIGFDRALYLIPLGLIAGYGLPYILKPKCYLLLDNGLGEQSILSSQDRLFVRRIAAAINRAISGDSINVQNDIPEVIYSGSRFENGGEQQVARASFVAGLSPILLPVLGFLGLIIVVNLFTQTGNSGAAMPYIVILIFLVLFIVDFIRKKK